ncbi:MAG: DUF4293 family protein [Bacteroidia bacterium]|nr:DUF4293 family protein [Bacteroidia bacterium]
MIQRIQSLYLLLTTLLSLLFLKGSFLNFIDKSGSVIKVTFNGIVRDTGGQGFEFIEKLLPVSAFIILIPAFSLVTIFIFKNRKIQLWLALSVIILIVGFIFVSIFYSMFVITEYGAEIVPGFKMVIPLLMLVFAVLAYRGIRKDDRLIKSNERLR